MANQTDQISKHPAVLASEDVRVGKLSYEEFLALYPPIAGAGVPDLNVFDIYQQAAITDLVRRNLATVLETIPEIGDQIAPLMPCYDRTIKREIAEVAAFGIGQFRAPDASPKIFVPKLAFTQEVSSLLLLDEMVEMKEDLWLRMTSQDDSIRARAGVDLVTQGRILQMRNERLTEVMRWTMFKGNSLIVNYDTTGLGGFQGANATQQAGITWPYMSGHKVTSAIPWTDRVNSTPVDDIRSWQQIVANDIGVYASRIHMNSITFAALQRSNQARGYLTPTDRNVYLPTASDIETLLWGGGAHIDETDARLAPPPRIIVSDAGYRDETQGYQRGMGAVTKYLLNGEVLLTVEYVHEGERIADVADGMVALSVAFNELKWVQGPQSEIIIDHGAKTHFFRQASARFPRLRRPEGFAYAKAF
jgi:hypothetical protein